jgi:hypothetical protein
MLKKDGLFMKLFRVEIEYFFNLLINERKFALARFGDGEMIAMRGEAIASGHGEWITNGVDTRYSSARKALYEVFTQQHKEYYIGIVCPCCQGMENFNKMRLGCAQSDESKSLTFANVFVNSNYDFFLDNYIPFFKENLDKIILVGNFSCNIDNFRVSNFYAVDYNAWLEWESILNTINQQQYKDKIFLFACGPLGKILSGKLWEMNKFNVYLDVGSALHPLIGGDINPRGYQIPGSFHRNLTCVWGEENNE